MTDRCAECPEPAVFECKRCAAPLCVDHWVPADRRCEACEDEWMERCREIEVAGRPVATALIRWSRVAAAVALGCVLLAMITGWGWLAFGYLAGGALFAAGLVAARVAAIAELPDRAVQRARAEFLAEPVAPAGEEGPARLPRARVVGPERTRR